MDILVESRDFIINLIAGMPLGLTSYVLRVGFMLTFSSVLLFVSWLYLPWRSILSQSIVALLAITASLYVPVQDCRNVGKEFLTICIIVSLLAMIYIPDKLAFWLTPRLGNQLKLKKIIICLIWAGLLIQIVTGA